MVFSVEADSNQWTVRVQPCGGNQTLYVAHRGGAGAAQVAAAEFAIVRVLGPASILSPARLGEKEWKWQEYW